MPSALAANSPKRPERAGSGIALKTSHGPRVESDTSGVGDGRGPGVGVSVGTGVVVGVAVGGMGVSVGGGSGVRVGMISPGSGGEHATSSTASPSRAISLR